MRHGLRAVDQHARAMAMRHLDHLARRSDRAERIGDLGERDDARPRIEQLLVFVEQHVAAVVDRRDAELCALLGAQHLPRHDVGVVLEMGDHHLVALLHVAPAPGLGHEVDRLGRAAHPHDGVVRRRVDESAHLLARRLEGVGRAGGQRMRGAMHVRVLVRVEMRQPVDDRLRLLRGRGVVEPDERLAVDVFAQDREVAAEDMRIELARAGDRRQRELRAVLRRERAEIERLAVPAVRQRRGAGRCAQALVEKIIRLARIGAAKPWRGKRLDACGRGRAGRTQRLEAIDRRRRRARTG